MKKAVKDHLCKPFMVHPRMVWSGIGIEVLRRKPEALKGLSAKKEVAPEVGVDFRIREKVEDGGEKKSQEGCFRYRLHLRGGSILSADKSVRETNKV